MTGLEELRQRATAQFRSRFGEPPSFCSYSPGRVNLIGEHTDYSDGFVFPVAIDRHVVVVAALAPDASKVWSESYAEPAVFDTGKVSAVQGWARFPAGCAWTLMADFGARSNINAFVVSDLPAGAGLSSSAAMELAFLTLWNSIDGLEASSEVLAEYGRSCEHSFVGVHCGVMDQMACALAQEGRAMLIDTRSKTVEYQSIPAGIEIVVCDTNKPRSLDVSAYNQRQAECAEAAREMGLSTLRDATQALLDGTFPQGDSVQYSRAKHVLTENERCVQFAGALADGDLAEIGRLMKASHESLRDDFEVSCAELDWMAESAWEAPGCIGARMTGAGFGGACVALVDANKLDGFLGVAERGYRERSNGLEPRFITCRSAAGAGTI